MLNTVSCTCPLKIGKERQRSFIACFMFVGAYKTDRVEDAMSEMIKRVLEVFACTCSYEIAPNENRAG